MALGSYIKETRCFLKMTQQELAEKAGISFQQLSQYEREVRTPKNETLEKIVGAMGFTLREFMWMYYSSDSNMDADEKELAKAGINTLPDPLNDELSALCELIKPSGYNLRCIRGEYYLTGKHGGYHLTEDEVKNLLNGSVQYIESLCTMLETSLMKST